MGKRWLPTLKTAAILVIGCVIGFVLAGYVMRGWDLSGWKWEVAAQPLATFGGAMVALIAAGIALHNGNETRAQEKEIYEERKRTEQERTLRERFTSIIEMLSLSEDYTKREAAAYALIKLSDDLSSFYSEDYKHQIEEQQTCLNILTGQLIDSPREPISQEVITFKRRIQKMIIERFCGNDQNQEGPWSNLLLNLANCTLYDFAITGKYNQPIILSSAILHGKTQIFPVSISGKIDFTYTIFKGEVFIGTIHHAKTYKIEGNMDFNACNFKELIIFGDVPLKGEITFSRSQFEKQFIIHGVNNINSMNFLNSSFEDVFTICSLPQEQEHKYDYKSVSEKRSASKLHNHSQISFVESTFSSDTLLHNTQIDTEILFEKSIFHKSLLAKNITGAGSLKFINSTFHDNIIIDSPSFNGQVSFGRSIFQRTPLIIPKNNHTLTFDSCTFPKPEDDEDINTSK